VALALIVAGAHVFVSNLETVAEALKVSSQILAIIITPIATELPEKFNSVIWIRQRKDTYALGNISGAMVFQSSIPPAIGIFFTPWALKESPSALAAALAALASTAFAWFELKTHKRLSPFSLLVGILFYVGYLVYIFGFNG
jgi:cation:H+ antiporter